VYCKPCANQPFFMAPANKSSQPLIKQILGPFLFPANCGGIWVALEGYAAGVLESGSWVPYFAGECLVFDQEKLLTATAGVR
jgi:hypothetical protein